MNEVLSGLAREGGAGDRDLRSRAASLSEGSVGRALSLLDPKRIALIDELDALLGALPAPPARRILALADKLADRRGTDDFPLAVDTMLRWLSARVEAGRDLGPARLAPLAEVCENVTEAARAVEVYNLDRRAFVVSTFGDLAEAVRRAS